MLAIMLRMRPLIGGLAAVAAIAALALSATAQAATTPVATAARTTCPANFSVLHNDSIGKLKLSAGPYTITVVGHVTCASASKLFTRFLEDWDGNLPDGWKVSVSPAGFVNKTAAFYVKKAKAPPIPPPSGGITCPGKFALRHNDKILTMSLPAGNYVVQVLKKNAGLTCNQANVWFAQFLTQNYKTALPSPWTMNAATKTFYKGKTTVGFRLKRTGGSTGGGGNHGATQCPGTFHVLATRAISGLTFKAGYYTLHTIGALTCQEVSDDFKLDLNLGHLPNKNWTLAKSTATFLFLKTKGFRVEPYVK
jgi:hypothetical protein